MRTVELTPRLRSVAELVPRGARFADVGTDHAYLPVWLLQQGRITGAVASDLRPGPLERARGTAEKYGLTGRMDFRLCDGLSGIQPDEVNTIAMAGMGGETILRRWLQAHDYTIRRELLSREGDTLYTTFEVYAGPMAKLTPAELWAGRQTRGEGSPLRLAYLDRLLRQTERAIAGLKRSKRPEDASRLAELEQVHQGLLDMKEEWLSWQR